MKKSYLFVAGLLMAASLSAMTMNVSAQQSIDPGTDPGTATCYSTYSAGGTTTIHKCENGCNTETVSTYSDKQDCTY